MALLLVLAFVVVPLVEIWVILQVGQVIGGWPTLLLLVADSLLGAWLLRREGARTWVALRDALAQLRAPGRELADAALVLVGGTLLLTPGFVTDLVGFFLVLPPTRPLARRLLFRVLARRVAAGTIGIGSLGSAGVRPRSPGPSSKTPPFGAPGRDSRVVPGEVVEPDADPADGRAPGRDPDADPGTHRAAPP
ncbi:MAG TPA: FxsA family protein [Jiangellales bacterium]|nr:FxsA family protein [Jiangellales bacterium]